MRSKGGARAGFKSNSPVAADGPASGEAPEKQAVQHTPSNRRSMTMLSTLKLPPLDGSDDGESPRAAARAERLRTVYTASHKGARLGGLTISMDQHHDTMYVFFNDKIGHIYQAPSPNDFTVDGDFARVYAKTSGRPNGMVAVRGGDGAVQLLVTDMLRKGILVVSENGFDVMVDRIPNATKPNRHRKFNGPNHVLPDSQGNVFFTDSGELRHCTAGRLSGSVFVATAPPPGSAPGAHPEVTPIIDGGLAYPSAMAWIGVGDLLICESFLNRILRAQLDRETGEWRVGIFARFQQRFGPTAIAVRRNTKRSGLRDRCDGDKFSVFVGHSALKAHNEEACVLRLTPKGDVAEQYDVPGSIYITSMVLRSPESLFLTSKERVLQLFV